MHVRSFVEAVLAANASSDQECRRPWASAQWLYTSWYTGVYKSVLVHRAEKQERALSQRNRERHAHETAIQVEQPCTSCCAILVLADNIAEGTSDFCCK